VRAIPIRGLPSIPVGWAARRFALLPPVAHEFMDIFATAARRWSDISDLRLIAAERGGMASQEPLRSAPRRSARI